MYPRTVLNLADGGADVVTAISTQGVPTNPRITIQNQPGSLVSLYEHQYGFQG